MKIQILDFNFVTSIRNLYDSEVECFLWRRKLKLHGWRFEIRRTRYVKLYISFYNNVQYYLRSVPVFKIKNNNLLVFAHVESLWYFLFSSL